MAALGRRAFDKSLLYAETKEEENNILGRHGFDGDDEKDGEIAKGHGLVSHTATRLQNLDDSQLHHIRAPDLRVDVL